MADDFSLYDIELEADDPIITKEVAFQKRKHKLLTENAAPLITNLFKENLHSKMFGNIRMRKESKCFHLILPQDVVNLILDFSRNEKPPQKNYTDDQIKDIHIIMDYTKVSWEIARKTYFDNHQDLIESIMELTM